MVRLTLAAVLKKKGITKYGFAKLLGERYSGVFRYFRPGYESQVKLATLEKWSKALGCKIKDLYRE